MPKYKITVGSGGEQGRELPIVEADNQYDALLMAVAQRIKSCGLYKADTYAAGMVYVKSIEEVATLRFSWTR